MPHLLGLLACGARTERRLCARLIALIPRATTAQNVLLCTQAPMGDLPQPDGDHPSDQIGRQRPVDGEAQRPGGLLVPRQLIHWLGQYRATVGQVAQVVLEGGKAGDRLACRRRTASLRDTHPTIG
jgi:hypothetical protein